MAPGSSIGPRYRRIVTNDSDFHRSGFLEVIDPLTAA
jgi:hypothetical protein